MTKFDQGWPEPSPVPDDPAPGLQQPLPGRQRPRWGWWLIAAIAVVVVAGIGAGLMSRPAPDRAADGPEARREAIGAAPAQIVTTTVVYEVSSGGAGDVGSIEYTDPDGDIIRRGGVPLPWRTTFTVTGEKPPLVLIAQRKKGGAGAVTCSITYGEKVLTTVTQTGRYAAPQCSA
ncbi:MmpS family transport accessory protein [Actinoplanes sp. NPDC051513]|uniref:MmpS family transport accessory protein n=1 Tax=Actinoplanes sp. NPDC051513 TaxID=3363908 RepID=UPI00379FD108